jgi:dihydropyrimidinase
VLASAHELGARVLVHAEDGAEIQARQADFVAKGKLAPCYHALSRPPECEAKAIAKIVAMVEEIGGPRVSIAHVSSELAMREIIKAKQKGLPVYAETCPQYLAFTADKYEMAPEKAAPFVISPPLRQKTDVEFLWRCIADGTVDFVSTDHCPFTLKNKTEDADNFMRIPNGAGGIAERMAFMLSEGHKRRGITIERIIDLTSRNAANFYGLPQPTGQDDFSVWDTSVHYVYKAEMGGSACDHSIWEGEEFLALPVKVVKGGRLVAENWTLVEEGEQT